MFPDGPDERLPPWADERALSSRRPLEGALGDAIDEAPADFEGLPLDAAGSLTLRRLPEVRFRVTDGQDLYNLDLERDGRAEINRLAPSSSTREKLLRLHKQHVDPGDAGARQTWTWLVDVMGGSMVLWGLTGVVMWWGIKSTRKPGLLAVASGVAAMVVMAGALWRALGVG